MTAFPAVDAAIDHLRAARTLLAEAGAKIAVRAARRALKSAEGAGRHVRHRRLRAEACAAEREGGAGV